MKRSIFVSLLCGMSFALGVPNSGVGQDTQPVITPNAMIIFDTSYSMNYKSDGGYPSASKVTVDSEGYRNGIDKDYQGPGTEYFFEMGGDHPLSKLYQAKLALKKVLNGLEGINLGFSTYGQSKTERRRGQYVRDEQHWSGPTKTQCTWTRLYFKYKNNVGSHTTSVTVPLPQKGTFTFDGTIYTGMDVGSKVYLKNHTFDVNTVPPHPPSTFKADLEYSISSVAPNPELNTITYNLKSADHYHYATWNSTYSLYTDDADCSEVKKTFVCDSATFPKLNGDYKTYWAEDRVGDKYPEDGSNVTPHNKWDCTGPSKTAKGSFGLVHQNYAWGSFAATTCPDTTGSASNWDGTKAVTAGSDGYSIYSAVDKVNKCYDVSDFNYPAVGDSNKPDIWSYYQIVSGNWTNWNTVPAPYYPSRDTSEQINNNPGAYDNHHFFINFPPVDDSTDGYKTKKSILDLLDLAPYQNMETLYYQTKLPVKSARYLDAEKTRPDNSITANTVGPTAVGGGPFASRTLSPEAQTPMASSLKAAKQYFSDYIEKYNGGDPASKAKCRGNFVIFLTDGLESCAYIDKPNKIVDYDAAVKAAEDLYKIGVGTFVIGFGAGTGGNTSILDEIALKGSDNKYKAFIADNLDKLIEDINTIFKMIFDSVSRGNPAVSTDRVAKDKNRFYRGFFKPGWEGHLASYKLDADGNIGEEVWDAGTIMNSKKDRAELYSWVEEKLFPERIDFRTREKDLYELVNPLNEDIDGDSKFDKNDAKTVIKFTIDPGYDSKKYKGVRSGDWFLGDIYHSTPLVLNPPAFKFPDDKFPKKYSTFKESWKDRETVLYVGSNDGMLHAFDKDGKEKFSVLPRNILGNLKELRNKDHQFLVDSSPRMSDAYLQGKWRTVVLTGERGGGKYYFALDVTDPTDPIILWEKSDPAMGNTWSRPEIGWVRIGGQEKFVAFVGGGYSVADDVGNTFYVLDMEDGTLLRKFTVPPGGDKKNKVAAGATAFDSDSDGRVDGVYFGDTSGVLWKIKIDLEEDISKWKLIKLFDPGTKHPIFYPPVVTKNNQKKILVYFGQGDELNIYDDTIANSFFEIWDKGVIGELSWERKLEKGEKVLASAAFANNIIYFTTFKYTGVVDNCGAGIGRIYGLAGTREGITGNKAALYLNPLTGDPFKDPKEYITITDYFPKLKGIPSAPVIVIDPRYTYYYFSTSGSGTGGGGRNPPAGQARLKYWREVF